MKAILLIFPFLCFSCSSNSVQEEGRQGEQQKTILLSGEEMPRFPGCEDMEGSAAEKKKCADQELLKHIMNHIQYPETARRDSTEGRAVVSFKVTHTGAITDVIIVQDPGNGLGEEAKRVVETMKTMPERWTPGRDNGVPVDVKYNLPIRFKLD